MNAMPGSFAMNENEEHNKGFISKVLLVFFIIQFAAPIVMFFLPLIF